MNPTSAIDPTAPPPPPPQPPRSSFSCDRHPTEKFAGFCPSCLCERLTTLDNSSSNTPSSSRRPSSASAAIKALFSSSKGNNLPPPPPPPKPSKPTSFFPELRRSKSFSASKNEALGLFFEPQRKSCDVRGRSSLWSLFSFENDNKTAVTGANDNKPSSALASASASSSSHHNPQISIKIESSVAKHPVFEETENEEDFKDPAYIANDDVAFVDDDDDEIRPVSDSHLVDNNFVEVELNGGVIVEEEEVSLSNLKPMKDHIDLDTQEKKSSGGGGGGFWAAASVFSKKWQKWRRKQKIKKQSNGGNSAKLPVEKPISRQFRETQSEIADYGYGRRSCDIDPRFSLDAGRISFDDPRYSLEEPRASWDGYVMGRRSFSRMAPTMVSVMEDAPSSVVHVSRTDMQIPLEETKINNDDESIPGGSTQTREYYLDSSSRRRKSLDRSSSIRTTAPSVVAEIDELKTVSNSMVSPTTADYFQGARISAGERELRDSNSNSLRDDCSETFELGNGFRDVSNLNGERKELKRSRRPWGWRIWGFIQRRNNNKDDDEDEKYSRVNGVERSYSESWRNGGDLRNGFNRNVFRSNSSVSWRNANHIGGRLASVRNSGFEMNRNGKKKRDEVVLEKNRSARYSPSHNNTDNGLLRFYMTPLRGSRRVGTGKIKLNGAQSIARSVLRMY